ncbi:hypothetical protein [Nostoc sp. UHCC 0251]|uniref:hypothetical protein n=1 Tax=Nostoc sp. UHCC 0251 TaxID=3110240 RepID=UPI002B21DFDA|nr:hypothetical protein [Nostoc sp. UHCC 0251]MEA5626652.1 hypothetical protein [Nostoc sp. UHCC 0251]
MDSKALQSTFIDAQRLQKLKDEIKQELFNILNNSNLSKIIEKYGISAQDILKLEYTLNLNQLRSNDFSESNDLSVDEQTQKLNKSCIVLRKPCPIDNHPDGCWMDC